VDPSLYVNSNEYSVDRLMGHFVDDLLHGGKEAFQELTRNTLEVFGSKPWE